MSVEDEQYIAAVIESRLEIIDSLLAGFKAMPALDTTTFPSSSFGTVHGNVHTFSEFMNNFDCDARALRGYDDGPTSNWQCDPQRDAIHQFMSTTQARLRDHYSLCEGYRYY